MSDKKTHEEKITVPMAQQVKVIPPGMTEEEYDLMMMFYPGMVAGYTGTLEKEPEPEFAKAKVKAPEGIDVFDGPIPDNKIDDLDFDAEVTILEVKGEFYKIKYLSIGIFDQLFGGSGEKEGWVLKSLIGVTEAVVVPLEEVVISVDVVPKEKEEKAIKRLWGKEKLYEEYKSYKEREKAVALPTSYTPMGGYSPSTHVPDEAETKKNKKFFKHLEENEFKDYSDFDTDVQNFRKFVARTAREMAKALLMESERITIAEGQRYYTNLSLSETLFANLASYRTTYEAKEDASRRYDGDGIFSGGRKDDRKERDTKKSEAEGEIKRLGDSFPVLKSVKTGLGPSLEDSIMKDLARASSAKEIQEILIERAGWIYDNIQDVKAELEANPERIWGIPKMIELARVELGIPKDTIYAQIIDDYQHEKFIEELIYTLGISVLSILLTIASGPVGGVVGASLAVGAAGLDILILTDFAEEFSFQQTVSNATTDRAKELTKDPDLFWLALAVAGTAVGVVQNANKAFELLTPIALRFNKSGNLIALQEELRNLRKIEKYKDLHEDLWISLEKSAIREANLKTALLGVKNLKFSNLFESKTYVELVKLAQLAIEQGASSVDQFILKLKINKAASGIDLKDPKVRELFDHVFKQGYNRYKAGVTADDITYHAMLKRFYNLAEEVEPAVQSLQAGNGLPVKYITKEVAENAGWSPGKSLEHFAPGKRIGGDIFRNEDHLLPLAPGRVWHEADIGVQALVKKRTEERLLYSNDGLLFITTDHYRSFIYLGILK